jgi:hypothetical protein
MPWSASSGHARENNTAAAAAEHQPQDACLDEAARDSDKQCIFLQYLSPQECLMSNRFFIPLFFAYLLQWSLFPILSLPITFPHADLLPHLLYHTCIAHAR